jgi:2-polyprenyl-6-hydroxyphenyl methylase / 3-demethylubiquinone-9 3-methyltransferase
LAFEISHHVIKIAKKHIKTIIKFSINALNRFKKYQTQFQSRRRDNVGMTAHTSNVDPNELAKFSELAHRWWDTESEFRPLHQINPLRLDWIHQAVPLSGLNVLDVGCGGGILADAMARRGATVTGIDLATKSLKVAQLHAIEAGTPNVSYREISAENMADEQPNQFDVVTCMEMLEHVPRPEQVVQACAQLVKPGGWVFFSTLNRNAKAFLFAIVGAEYVLNLLPRGTHEYAKLIRPSELARFARDAGLNLRQTRGMEYNPLTKRYRMSEDTSVNYLLATQKPA